MATTARLDLSVWRNDDVYEFPLRVRGLDLTGVALRAQIRLGPDTPGSPLAALSTVTNGNAEGIRLASVAAEGGVPVSDVRIRINKTTRQALPYAGEIGDATSLAWALQIAGRTRITGRFLLLAHTMDSDAAPGLRATGLSSRYDAEPSGGATLTIGADNVVEITIDGADLVAGEVARAVAAAGAAEADAESAQFAASAALASSRYFPSRAEGETGSTAGQAFATDDGAGNIIYYRRTSGGSAEFGRALTPASLGADGAAEGIGYDGRSIAAKLTEVVSVTDPRFANGAKGDGVTDDTAAFQAAIDAHPGGVIVQVPPGVYPVDRIDVRSRHIAIRLDDAATLKRAGTPSVVNRAIFRVENLLEAHFSFEGGTVDLNGEGPIGIGIVGRNANAYQSQTVAGTIAMAGPNSELLFSLRSSHIAVRRTTVKNSGETGILHRNSSDTVTEHVRFLNLGNAGVEFSWAGADVDGGTGLIPDCGRHYVRWCHFEDIDDFGLGTGNGAGVLGGGSPAVSVIRTVEVESCTFVRCLRDVHFEISSVTAYVEAVRLSGGRSHDAGQGSVGFVNARGSVDDWEAFNPGGGPVAALSPSYSDVYGFVVSGPNTGRVTLTNVRAIQNVVSMAHRGTDGQIAAGSEILTSPSASFAARDVGRPIGILGAGPASTKAGDPGYCAHLARIVEIISPSKVRLSRAAVSGVVDATFAYGSALREGIRLYQAVDVAIANARIEGGIFSGLPGEPPSAAINVVDCFGRISVNGASLTAPTTPGTAPFGLRLAGAMAGTLRYRSNEITGFDAAYGGIDNYRAVCIGPALSSPNGASIMPANAADTDGNEVFIAPRSGVFTELAGLSFIPAMSSETLSVTVRGYRFDNVQPNTAIITLTAGGVERALTDFEKWQVNQDNAPLRAIGIKVKSTKGGSTAAVPYFLRALEG